MEKLISIFLLSFLSFFPKISRAEALLGTFDINLGAGLRLGRAERSNKASNPYLGLRVSHTEFKFAGSNRVSLFSVGVNFDPDRNFSLSISPIMIIIPNSVSVGFDYFSGKSSSNSGNLGMFLGIPFSGSK